MNPVDDEAPTQLREVIRDRTASDAARTKLYRPAIRECAPRTNAATPDIDSIATAHHAQVASASAAPHAQTVVRPLRTRAAQTKPAPRSRGRELALRLGLAIVVSTVALGAALASTDAMSPRQHARPEGLAPAMPVRTGTATPIRATSPSSTGATAPDAPSTFTSPSPSPTPALTVKSDATNGDLSSTPVASPAEAARLLATGAYAPALDAYRALARSEPDAPVYAVIVRVLERNLGARCDRSQTPGDPTCSTHNTQDTTATPPSSH